MKVASWNVNSLKVRLDQLLEWLDEHDPDIMGLQETKTIDANFPIDELQDMGYYVSYTGQKTYNGVAVLSRKPVRSEVEALPDFEDEQKRFLAVTIPSPAGDVRFINVYVPNGQALDSDKFQYKERWLTALRTYIKQELEKYPNLVLVGDFNITREDRDVHDPEAWHEKVHCSSIERGWLNELMDLGLVDTFRAIEQEPESYSWWDYRGGGIWKNMGLRIDYVFATPGLVENMSAAWIDKAQRTKEQPSDHAPVVAEFDL